MKITGKSPQPWENTGGGKNPKLKKQHSSMCPQPTAGRLEKQHV